MGLKSEQRHNNQSQKQYSNIKQHNKHKREDWFPRPSSAIRYQRTSKTEDEESAVILQHEVWRLSRPRDTEDCLNAYRPTSELGEIDLVTLLTFLTFPYRVDPTNSPDLASDITHNGLDQTLIRWAPIFELLDYRRQHVSGTGRGYGHILWILEFQSQDHGLPIDRSRYTRTLHGKWECLLHFHRPGPTDTSWRHSVAALLSCFCRRLSRCFNALDTSDFSCLNSSFLVTTDTKTQRFSKRWPLISGRGVLRVNSGSLHQDMVNLLFSSMSAVPVKFSLLWLGLWHLSFCTGCQLATRDTSVISLSFPQH